MKTKISAELVEKIEAMFKDVSTTRNDAIAMSRELNYELRGNARRRAAFKFFKKMMIRTLNGNCHSATIAGAMAVVIDIRKKG